MSRRKKRTWVSFDDVTDEQLAFLIESATGWLIGKANDLPPVSDDDDWKREAEEVAALGRLVTGLHHGEILLDDAIARELAARSTTWTDSLEELTKEYRREAGEHEAWVALVARFDAAADGKH